MLENTLPAPPQTLQLEEIARKLDLALTCLDDEHTSLAKSVIRELLAAIRK